MPRPTDDDDLGGRQVHRARGFPERRLGLLANRSRVQLRREAFHLGRRRLRLDPRGMRPPGSRQNGRGPAGLYVCVEFALEELPDENGAAFVANADHVADQRLVEARGQLGREVADLVCVGEQHERRLNLADEIARSPLCSRRPCSSRVTRARPHTRDQASSTQARWRARQFPGPVWRPRPFARALRPASARPPASRTTCGSMRRRAAP